MKTIKLVTALFTFFILSVTSYSQSDITIYNYIGDQFSVKGLWVEPGNPSNYFEYGEENVSFPYVVPYDCPADPDLKLVKITINAYCSFSDIAVHYIGTSNTDALDDCGGCQIGAFSVYDSSIDEIHLLCRDY